MSAEEGKEKTKRPKMQSLLEEHLDIITEGSEHSEGSSSVTDLAATPSVASTATSRSSSPTKEIRVSPRKSSRKEIQVSPRKSPKKSPRSRRPKVSEASDEKKSTSSRTNHSLSLAPLDELTTLQEEEGGQLTRKFTESSGEESYDVSTDDGEQLAFDGDCSVMMFDYDDEEDEDDGYDGGHSSSRSVTSHSVVEEDDLSWRLDPSESLSDWTIKVINKGTRSTETYHVHKNMLGVGKRKSEYFASVFRQAKGNNKSNNVTEITVEDSAAKVVPMLLDYIYSDDAGLQLSANTAPGLRYLAQFFGVRLLFEKVMAFIQKDLSLKTLGTYYKASSELGDKKVWGIAARHCARNLHLIDTSHELLKTMDPVFFNKVLSTPGLESTDKKMHISRLIAAYCIQHKDTLDGPNFLKLTTEEHLPQIDHVAALTLLGMEADLVVATSVMTMMTVSSLQERCIKSLASHWKDLTELNPERTAAICRKVPSFVVTELLLRSLDNAKKDCEFPSGEKKKEVEGKLKRELSKRFVRAKKTDEANWKAEHEQEMAKVKEEYESKLEHLQELCYEKDKIIKDYYEEIGYFCRLPNSHDGKLTSSGRSSQPTVMPQIGKHSKDGYLLAGRKLSGSRYPIFYYKKEKSADPEAAKK